jgi:hypothetical protein
MPEELSSDLADLDCARRPAALKVIDEDHEPAASWLALPDFPAEDAKLSPA